MEEQVKVEMDQADAEANTPEKGSHHYANDWVFPNQSHESGDRVKDHERENKQRYAPENANVPDAEPGASI
jgi:hypothetical protein